MQHVPHLTMPTQSLYESISTIASPIYGRRLSLLLAHTDCATSPTRRLAVLSTHSQTPVVSQPTMCTNLLQALQIFTQLAVHTVGQDLAVLAIHDVALTIEKPGWDLVLGRALDDGHDALEFFGSEIAGAVRSIMLVIAVQVLLSLERCCTAC